MTLTDVKPQRRYDRDAVRQTLGSRARGRTRRARGLWIDLELRSRGSTACGRARRPRAVGRSPRSSTGSTRRPSSWLAGAAELGARTRARRRARRGPRGDRRRRRGARSRRLDAARPRLRVARRALPRALARPARAAAAGGRGDCSRSQRPRLPRASRRRGRARRRRAGAHGASGCSSPPALAGRSPARAAPAVTDRRTGAFTYLQTSKPHSEMDASARRARRGNSPAIAAAPDAAFPAALLARVPARARPARAASAAQAAARDAAA